MQSELRTGRAPVKRKLGESYKEQRSRLLFFTSRPFPSAKSEWSRDEDRLPCAWLFPLIMHLVFLQLWLYTPCSFPLAKITGLMWRGGGERLHTLLRAGQWWAIHNSNLLSIMGAAVQGINRSTPLVLLASNCFPLLLHFFGHWLNHWKTVKSGWIWVCVWMGWILALQPYGVLQPA